MDTAPKTQKPTAAAPSVSAAKTPLPAAKPARVPPLFRRIDWMAMLMTFAIIWTVYFLTLAPEVTLEDSGELCTGAFYAGIPHPPGYPFWSIYSWIWTKLLPVGNVAWRVEVGESTAAALACALVALVVSRGGSMLMESLESLKGMTGKWENAICAVSGVVSGLILGLGGVMWGESVAINRISLFGVPWLMILLVCLLRWIYAPHQKRYLYWALFLFGICFTIHQTLLVAAMGIEVAIAAVQPRMGRYLFLGNSVIYFMGLIAQSTGVMTLLDPSSTAFMVLLLYHVVGFASISAYIWFAIRTRETFKELCLDVSLAALLTLAVYSITSGTLVRFATVLALAAVVKTAWDARRHGLEWMQVILLGILWLMGASFYFYEPIAGMTDPPMQWGYPRTVDGFFHALTRGQYERANPTNVFTHTSTFIMQLGMLVDQIAHEFNWVCVFIALVPWLFYFRMKKRERSWLLGLGSIYLCIGVLLVVLMNPSPDRQMSDLIQVFFTSSHAVVAILFGYGLALTTAYMAMHYQKFRVPALVVGALTLLPAVITLYNGVDNTFYGGESAVRFVQVFYLFLSMTATFVLAVLAVEFYERSTASAGGGASGQDDRLYFATFAGAALVCLGVSFWLAFYSDGTFGFVKIWTTLPKIFRPNQYKLPVIGGLLVLGISVIFIVSLLLYRKRAPLAITLGLFTVLPLSSGLTHWAMSEQRGHWFGYWFGHDMFSPPFKMPDGKPIYPHMARNAILFGGTDPGRFCPTYMIFCESFIPHHDQPKLDQHFDRRDVYLITQNALADNTYLDYLRAQYNRSQQHDPPFFSELARFVFKDKSYQTNILARLVSPLDTFFEARGARIEKRWRTYTSWFNPSDFTNLPDLVTKLRPGPHQDPVSKWLYQNFSPQTQKLLEQNADDARLRTALADDLNRLLGRELDVKQQLAELRRERESVEGQIADDGASSKLKQRDAELTAQMAKLHVDPLYTPQRFAHVKISPYLQSFIAQNPQEDTRIRLNRLLLEAAYPTDIAHSLSGVYPDREIYIPSPEDSARCFQEYIEDAARRARMNPPELRPGENVSFNKEGQVQVTGQVAVMAINGLLTKVIFDHNPDNKFYVEESFPLDWMYPHLTPFGDIMQIHRKVIPEISEEVVRRDHEFWTQYSARLIGNWITYHTTVKQIVAWIDKMYLEHNFTGFTGDRRFIRDNSAQKSFSKLRDSVAGIYAWRLGISAGLPTPPQYLPHSVAERDRMIKEADFAFRQAFAFCPYSPEAVMRYANFLMDMGRVDDALLVVRTCHKLDPENGAITGLISQLERYKNQPNPVTQVQERIGQLEKDVRANPNDFQKAFDLASSYMQLRETDRASAVLDNVLANPHVQVNVVLAVAQFYAQVDNLTKLTLALEKLTQLAPDKPESWYDLAAARATLGQTAQAASDLKRALDLDTNELAKNPKASNLKVMAQKDPRFASLRTNQAYQTLFQAK